MSSDKIMIIVSAVGVLQSFYTRIAEFFQNDKISTITFDYTGIGKSLQGKDTAQYCPGEICDAKQKHEIQKISGKQWIVLLGLVTFLFLLSVTFKKNFQAKPHNLFRKNKYESK